MRTLSPRVKSTKFQVTTEKTSQMLQALSLTYTQWQKSRRCRVLLGPKEEKSVWVLEEKPGSGLFPTLLYSFHQLIKFNRKEKIKSLFITGRLTGVWGIWGELAELSIERKIKLSKLDMETSIASSPISTNIIHVILCLLRKGIYLPPERCLGSCVKEDRSISHRVLTLHRSISHTQHPKAQRITSKAHLLASLQ